MEDILEDTTKYTKKVETLELQLCPELVEENYLTNLANTLIDIRKKIFDTYGVPLPPIKITCSDTEFTNQKIQIKIFITGYCIREIIKKEKQSQIPGIIYNSIKHNLPRCITATTIEKFYDEVQKDNSTLITTLRSFTNSYAAVRRVLKELIAEYIPIRNLPLIFESILECYAQYDINYISYWRLLDAARMELAPVFITELLNSNREFICFNVSKEINSYFEYNSNDNCEEGFMKSFIEEIGKILKGNPNVALVLDLNDERRHYYHYILKPFFPDLRVIKKSELTKAKDFSPLSIRVIKTIDTPIPKKEESAISRPPEKKFSSIRKRIEKILKKK